MIRSIRRRVAVLLQDGEGVANLLERNVKVNSPKQFYEAARIRNGTLKTY